MMKMAAVSKWMGAIFIAALGCSLVECEVKKQRRCLNGTCSQPPGSHIRPSASFAFGDKTPISEPIKLMSGSRNPENGSDPDSFLTTFYRILSKIVHEGEALYGNRSDIRASMNFQRSTRPVELKPTPSESARSPMGKEEAIKEINKMADSLFQLIMQSIGGRDRMPSGPKPSPHPDQPQASPIQRPAGSMHDSDKNEENRRRFRKFIFDGLKGKRPFLASLLLPEKPDIRNETRLKGFVEQNLPKVAGTYVNFIKKMLSHMESLPCPGACQKIQRMVEFCKSQHQKCSGGPPRMSIRPSHSAAPTQHVKPSPSTKPLLKMAQPSNDKPCPERHRRCPFQRECVPEDVRCIHGRDIFDNGGMRPTPSASRASPMEHASRYLPAPRPDGAAANRSLLGTLWKEAAKTNSSMKPEGLQKMFDNLRRKFIVRNMTAQRPEGEAPEKADEKCAKMCDKRNSTFCWAEMRCKRMGSRCSLQHLVSMMNRSAFEEQSNCSGGFYCPVFSNCSRDREACNPRKFISLPCDEECMKTTAMKGRNASREDALVFGLRCKDDDQYCPGRFGCVAKAESCASNPKLTVPEGMQPKEEKRVFCRVRDYLCPRVFHTWMRMKQKCSLEDDHKPDINIRPRPTRIPIGRSTGIPPHKPTKTADIEKPPIHHTRSIHTRSPTIRPSKSRGSSTEHRPTEGPQPITPTSGGSALPFITLNSYLPLRMQIKLRETQFILIAAMSCRAQMELKLITTRNRAGATLSLPQVAADNAMVRGMLVPLDSVLRFEPRLPNFYGVCILKYTVFSPPRRGVSPSEQQILEVGSGRQFGHIAMVVFPKAEHAEVSLAGRDHIMIDEDTQNPPCFKLKDKLNITRGQFSGELNIPAGFESLLDKKVLEDYKSKLNALKNVKVQVAVVSCMGHPWISGRWQFKGADGRIKSFPNECSERRPVVLDLNMCVAFYPRKDFDRNVRLKVKGAVIINDNGKSMHVLGKRIVEIGVNIRSLPDAPELSAIDACLPSLPFNLDHASNNGFKVEDVIKAGKASCGSSGRKKDSNEPLLQNIGKFAKGRIGIAVKAVSKCANFGHWESKADGGAFQRIQIRGGGFGFCLNSSASIRFVPANYSKLWSVPKAQDCVWVKIHAFAKVSGDASGACNLTSDSDILFSKGYVQLSLPIKGCDDVIGSMRKPDGCGKCGNKRILNINCPCDGVLNSGAVIDECGRCSGGRTGRVYHKRDCARKCYANGTLSENVLNDCNVCTKRSLARHSARDCNGDCQYRSNRACINKCGICVGGKTSKPLNQGINNCGVCIANATSACSRMLRLVSAAEVSLNARFLLKIKATGYSYVRQLSCSLLKAGGAASSAINIGRAFARGEKPTATRASIDSCPVTETGDYVVQLFAILQEAGEYELKCKVDSASSDTVVTGGTIRVAGTSSSVQGVHPPNIKKCSNGTFIIKGTDFRNTSSIVCAASCERYCDFKMKARFINSSAVACSINVPSNGLRCVAQRINLHVLSSSAVRPPSFSSSSPSVSLQCSYPRALSAAFHYGVRILKIQLNKPVSFHKINKKDKAQCSTLFDSSTARKLGNSRCFLYYDKIVIYLSASSKLISEASGSNVVVTLNRERLRCRNEESLSVLSGSNSQTLTISLPSTNVKAKINGQLSIGTCDRVTFNGRKSSGGAGGKIQFTWEVLRNSSVVQRESRRSWIRVDGKKLMANKEYTVKLCVRNMFGQSNCEEKLVRTIDNSNNTMAVRIFGDAHRKIKARGRYTFRTYAKLTQCGRASRKPSAMKFSWVVKGTDGAVVKNNVGRYFKVKQGDLRPGKNYTLEVAVRAFLESGEVLNGEASATVEVDGSPLVARIRGGKKMTVGCNGKAVFDARPSSDPDETDETARYSYECTEEDGSPCFKSSDPSQRLLIEEKDLVSLNVNGNLECNKSYVFKLTYSKGGRESTYRCNVTTKAGEPAVVSLDQKRTKNKIIITAFIKTRSRANSSWNCVEKEGYNNLDCSDSSIVRIVRSGVILVRKGRSTVRRHIMIVNTDFLPEGEKYLIQLNVDNEDGSSSAQIEVTSPVPPTQGEVTVEPSNGTALNTSFTVSADIGWPEGLSFEFGYHFKTPKGIRKMVLKSYGAEVFLEGVQLPPGDPSKNNSVTVYVIGRNDDGLTAKATVDVVVKKPEEISKNEVKDLMSQSEQMIKEGDFEAAQRLLATLAESSKSVSMQTDGESVQEGVTKQVLSVIEEATDDQSRETALTTLASTTLPVDGEGLPGDTRQKVAKATTEIFGSFLGQPTVPTSRRRRRSVESSSEESFTVISKEEVDSTMTIFDNLIDEASSGSYQDDNKLNFTNTVPSLLRSLCAGVVTTDEYLVSTSNLSTIRSNRLSGFTFDSQRINMSSNNDGSQVLLGSYFRQKYESWNCSNSGLQCSELCVATALYHHHLFPGEFSGRVSDIAETFFIHPESHSLENPGSLTSSMQFTMVLKEVPDAQHKVECRTWDSVGSNWTTEGCTTVFGGGNIATCNCTEVKRVTVFKVALPVLTTLFPTTTNQGNSTQNRTSPPTATSRPTAINATGSSTTRPSSGESQESVVVSFKFPVDYYAFSSKADELKKAIIDMLVAKLQISRNRITNLEIKPGSIIVTFTLLNNSGHSNEQNVQALQSLLTTMANNGTLSLNFSGTVFTADPASLTYAVPKTTTQPPPPGPKPKPEKSNLIIILVVVSCLVVAIIIIVVVILYMKKRQRSQKSKALAGSTRLFSEDIKLQARSTSPESYGTDNQRFIDSPVETKKPPESPGVDARDPRAVTPVGGSPENPHRPASAGKGAVVAVGIGSSTSLKGSVFN